MFPILPLLNTDDSSVTEENEKEQEPELSRRREALHEVDGDDEPQWKWWEDLWHGCSDHPRAEDLLEVRCSDY